MPGEFTKRYVVEGGVARRAVERDDTPKYEPSIYNYKCSEDSSGSRSPTPSKEEQPAIEGFGKDTTTTMVVAVNAQKSPHGGDGEHSDNCSEVSDEGYRSLGAVQLSSANGNSAGTPQASPTVADCQSKCNVCVCVCVVRMYMYVRGHRPRDAYTCPPPCRDSESEITRSARDPATRNIRLSGTLSRWRDRFCSRRDRDRREAAPRRFPPSFFAVSAIRR